jgi:methyl-accepting chemotaxis protein
VTQQNAAMVEESTAASHALTTEARELGRLVERFTIGDVANGHHAQPHHASEPAPIKSPLPRPVPQMKTTAGFSGGGAAPMPTSDADSWEEF